MRENTSLLLPNENTSTATSEENGDSSDQRPSTSSHSGRNDELNFYFKLLRCWESRQSSDPSPGSTMASQASPCTSPKTAPLRVCASCQKTELQPYIFKKCQKCEDDNFSEKHYYCSKECQVEDWIEFHRDEHRKYNH